MVEIEIADEVYDALKVPEADRDGTVKTELALSLYDRGILSFGKARELAGLSKRDFHHLLGDREIERHYTEADLDEDVRYARR